MVSFDVDSDPGFTASLEVLETLAEIEILEALSEITSLKYSWTQFISEFGWEEVIRRGEQTYPGAEPLYKFVIRAANGRFYELFGSTFNNVVIVCAVARIGELNP